MVQELESLVWANDHPIPVHQTATAVKHGGLVLGAFVEDKLIGFQYSFAGFNGHHTYLCSHALGIHPEYRIAGIGEKLKRTQREIAIQKGYDLIVWTYDPLETVNGYLNIKKLGAICSSYEENCYGDMTDVLNMGLPSDRFMVEWWIKEDRTVQTLGKYQQNLTTGLKAKSVLTVKQTTQGIPCPEEVDLTVDDDQVFLQVPVPAKFQLIKDIDLDIAINWRLKTRAVFTHYFQQGWQVFDFIKADSNELNTVHSYVMRKMTK